MVDLTADQIRELKRVFGSMHDAALAAVQDPVYADEFRSAGIRVVKRHGDGSMTFTPPSERYAPLFWRLVWAAHVDAGVVRGGRLHDLGDGEPLPLPAARADQPQPLRHDGGGPSRIPEAIIERALQLHEQERHGRRSLAQEIPGLTEYQASQVLRWYRIGKPAGLWLVDGRLKWGRAISTTPDGLRLPRL